MVTCLGSRSCCRLYCTYRKKWSVIRFCNKSGKNLLLLLVVSDEFSCLSTLLRVYFGDYFCRTWKKTTSANSLHFSFDLDLLTCLRYEDWWFNDDIWFCWLGVPFLFYFSLLNSFWSLMIETMLLYRIQIPTSVSQLLCPGEILLMVKRLSQVQEEPLSPCDCVVVM